MDRVALVTGGAQGIGRGIVRRFAREGWEVFALDADREAGEECAAAEGAVGAVRFLHADVADETAVARAVDGLRSEAGRLDALVNNAGIAAPGHRRIEELERAEWDHVLAVNLTGVFLVCKHAASLLRAARGSIVNIASTRAWQSEANTFAYTASKGGVVALTHALAVSLGPEVRANSVSPGWIDVSAWRMPARRRTGVLRPEDHAQHPAGRVGTPDDIAALVFHLASDEAGFITGQDFVADGGMTRKMIYAE